jgi:glycosyltransferase involved in cell wall biosynthesis
MRILIITAFVEGYGGGTGRVAYDMAEAFSKEYEVALVCPAEKTGIIEVRGNLSIYGIKSFTSMKSREVSFSWWSPKNKKEFYNFIERFSPDVIHSHQPVNIDTVALKYASEHGIPFFYTGHVLPTKALLYSLPGKIAKPINSMLNKTILKPYFKSYLKFCDGIVTLNKYSYEDHEHVADYHKLHIIPNGKNLQRFYNKDHPKISEKEIRLIFVGYLSARKNQEFLIEVMKYLPSNYKLLLAGPPLYKSYLELLKHKINTLKLKNVKLLGSFPYENIPELYGKAHILVSAATLEVQSLVVIEALASGTPVVGLSNETVDELIKDGENGYRLPKNASPKEFAEKIKEITSLNEEKYDQMCKNAHESSKMFDWQNVINKTIEMYNEAKREHEERKRREMFKLNTVVMTNVVLSSLLYLLANMSSFFKGIVKRKKLN